MLSCLRRAKEPLSAYAILDRVRVAGISHPPTVYRALNELIQLGMAHRLQSRSAFVACGHGVCNGKAAFAICRQCERVVEIPLSDKNQGWLLALSSEGDYSEQVTLEIAGLCAACRSATGPPPPAAFSLICVNGEQRMPWTREAASAMETSGQTAVALSATRLLAPAPFPSRRGSPS